MSQPNGSDAIRNHILASLPPEDLAHLRPQMQVVRLASRKILMAPGETIAAVFFPLSGWFSMIAQLADGRSIEVGLAGAEGMVGLPLLLECDTSLVEVMAQAPTVVLRLEAAAFRKALASNPAWRTRLLRYSLAFQDQVAQTAACNGVHTLDERLARWLLMVHDRCDGDQMPLTQELIAMMLGVQRPGVTRTAQALQRNGLIRNNRGSVTVTDRAGLEAASCDCYSTVRQRYQQLSSPKADQHSPP